MKDLTDGKLNEALKYAESIKDPSLQRCLDRLKESEKNYKKIRDMDVDTHIYTDFAPLSFEFVKVYYKNGRDYKGDFMSNGGIIFHGKHDNGGDGGAPTFSVCLEPVNGWSIHT